MNHARAILWAQWRTLLHFYPRAGAGWTAVIGMFWYGFWVVAACAAARVAANPREIHLLRVALPGTLLIVLLYWQVVPLLMASTGASLDLRKLQAYPIPMRQLFAIEVMLRLTSGIEMALVLAGIGIGAAFNPLLPHAGSLVFVLYAIFNLFVGIGIRDALLRAMARKRFREVIVFALVMLTALPQLILGRTGAGGRLAAFFSHDNWLGLPWSAAANLAQGQTVAPALGILLLWTLAAALFGYGQFRRTLAFDQEAAASRGTGSLRRNSVLEKIFRLPSVFFGDPLGALVEKEIRTMVRSPRFRLVFLMGFSFGLVILVPVSLGKNPWFGRDYLSGVSIYSLMLLSEACFWNSFGFDRSAAQFYFLAPIPFTRVLVGKNLSSAVFIALEITAIAVVCALLRLPVHAIGVVEAYAVAGVVTIFLLAAGNLLSIHQARGVNPGAQMRTSAAGQLQAMLLVIYPVALIPIGLAYLARYAFDSEWAFFGVLAFDAACGFIVYRIALQSATEAAGRMKEQMIANLSMNASPVAG
jgi:ABC-2 type transport system permease protein